MSCCALYGYYDFNDVLPPRVKKKLIRNLSTFSLSRGRDACGMAYVSNGDLCVFKIGKPANKVKFYFPDKTRIVAAHNRASTIGDPHKAENAHPFKFNVGNRSAALSHNGILYGLEYLRQKYSLPPTPIETDSFVAAQLLSKFGDLSMKSLADMAEAVTGSFSFTILDNESNQYFIKGDCPLSISFFEELQLWIYASTQEILRKALVKSGLGGLKSKMINLSCGDILKIGSDGTVERGSFETLSYPWFSLSSYLPRPYGDPGPYEGNSSLHELIELGRIAGVKEDEIQQLFDAGYETTEIEELLEYPVLLRKRLEFIELGRDDDFEL
jgi:glucosamine--fructose-6-phosphate aminotransferase (isomerizing)